MPLPVISQIRARTRVVGFEALRAIRVVLRCLGTAVRDCSPNNGAGRKPAERRAPAVAVRISIAPSVMVMMMPTSAPLNGDDVGGQAGLALHRERRGARTVHAQGGRKESACNG